MMYFATLSKKQVTMNNYFDRFRSTGDLYQIHVKQPSWMRHTESYLTEVEIQDLSEIIGALFEIAPELDFKFRISITAEGEPPSNEVLEQINEALRKVTGQLKFN